MSDIAITEIIKIDNPEEFKFHAARSNNLDQPLDVYVRDKKVWAGWNTWGSKRNDFSRKYIFSLTDFYHETDMWLFGGVYEVTKRYFDAKYKDNYRYEINELKEYSNYVGRLKVKLEKPSRGRAFYLERYLNQMMVSEILKEPYSGEKFPGYENINHDFSELVQIFANDNLGWKAALENVKGVYVIMDKSNGKKYVGSAYGDSGIWSRWSCYMQTGHGGNDELVKLIEEKGFDYAKENFSMSLLEYRPMKVDDQTIIDRETYWKKVFLSNKFGYNLN